MKSKSCSSLEGTNKRLEERRKGRERGEGREGVRERCFLPCQTSQNILSSHPQSCLSLGLQQRCASPINTHTDRDRDREIIFATKYHNISKIPS